MSELQWSDELSVGVDKIDDEHRVLIGIANELITAVRAGGDTAVVSDIINRLREYTVSHFNNEETLMRDVDYPELHAHLNAHARLKDGVKIYRRQIYEQSDVTANDILQFVKGWLLGHILQHDRDLARFIREKGAAEPGKPLVIGNS